MDFTSLIQWVMKCVTSLFWLFKDERGLRQSDAIPASIAIHDGYGDFIIDACAKYENFNLN